MDDNDFELKECFDEVAVLAPLGVAVICMLVLVICLHHYWSKSRSGEKDAAHRDREIDQMEINELKQVLENVRREKEAAHRDREIDQMKINELKQDLENVRREKEAAHRDRIIDQMKINELKQDLESVRGEKEAANLRLSEIMSARLRDGNPDIADLSDENRPTKLRDTFSELYDNAYTDAANDLGNACATSYSSDNELTEEMSAFMLNILMIAFRTCMEKAQKQLVSLQQLILDPCNEMSVNQQHPVPRMEKQLPPEFIVKVMDQRKAIMPDLASINSQVDSQMANRYSRSLFDECLGMDSVRSYTKQCVETTWLMAIQDPPMYLNFNEERKECLREYTRTGPTFDFLVWPSLFLKEGGSMMSKGVAQFQK